MFAQMEQDRAAFEDRPITVREPGHLTEWLVSKVCRLAVTKRDAPNPIGQPRFLQCPTHAQITDIAAAFPEPSRTW